MSVGLSLVLNGWRGFLANGSVNAGGFIYTYLAGTSTPATTYTTSSGLIANSNPIVLNSGGLPSSGGSQVEIWLTVGVSYKFVIFDALMNQIEQYDNISGDGTSAYNLNYPPVTFASLALTPALFVGQIVTIQGHTNLGIGGGQFEALLGSVANDGGTQINSATSGIYWKRINYSRLYVEFFGANPTAGFDNYTAISNAIAAASYSKTGKIDIYFDYGIYEIKTNLPKMTSPIKFIGVGPGDTGAPLLITSGSSIRYTGANQSSPIFWIQGVYFGGWGLQDITFDCNNLIQGVSIDSCCGGRIENLTVRDDINCGFELLANAAQTCSFNTIINLNVDNYNNSNGVACLRTNGAGAGGYNSCHNTFINTRLAHKGNRHAIVLGDCDNITFIMTYINTVSGAGKGVYCDSTFHAGFPGNNLFFHLQAGTGGYYQDAGCIHPGATIYGYQLDNGQPEPVNAGSAQAGIVWTSDNGRFNGVRSVVYRNLADQLDFGNNVITAGSTTVTVPITSPNTNYQVRISFTNNAGANFWWWIANRTTTSFDVKIGGALGGNLFFDWKIERSF